MSLSCCFQRLTWVKSTSLQLLGDKSSSFVQIISNYVHLTVIICTYLVILSFDVNKPPYTCVNMSPVHPGYKNSSVLIQTIYPSLISLMVSVDVKHHVYKQFQSSGGVWKSRWTSWAPVPNKPTVSVEVKQHFSFIRTILVLSVLA